MRFGRTLRVPLQSYAVPEVPIALLRVRLTLLVGTASGWRPVSFCLDTGASMSTMSVTRANNLGVSFPKNGGAISIETALGRVDQVRHFGALRVRVPDWGDREFRWPCHFLEQSGPPSLSVLGLTGPLANLHWSVDGRFADHAPYGTLRVKELT